MTALGVSRTHALPVEFITDSNGILAKKGAGKTNALVVLVEEMYRAGAPVVTIDPKGDHYGIRSSADGKKKGLPIPVFGGRHGDIPLEPTAGALIADLIREKNLSVVLDVSQFLKAERRRFLTAFTERLYQIDSHVPMHLFLEECHEYIPQAVTSEDAAMVGVFERIVKLGRWKGIGVTMSSQRSASVNKNVLTQIDNLFVLRTISKPDRDVVKGWIDTNAEASSILAELPSLQNGECWLWQPERGDPVKFRFRMRDTFDAGATPKMGEVAITPTTIADVDLAEISAAMESTIEKAKADDPKALRARIEALTREVAAKAAEIDVLNERITNQPPSIVEVPVLTEQDHQRLANQANLLHQSVLDMMRLVGGDLEIHVKNIRETAEYLTALASPTKEKPPALVSTFPKRLAPPAHAPSAPVAFGRPVAIVGDRTGRSDFQLQKAHRAILTVLAQRGTQTVQQVSMLAGYTASGGGFRNALGALRTAGYLEPTKDPLTMTDAGMNALGTYEPLPAGRALIDHWLNRVGGRAERLILEELIAAWPEGVPQDALAIATGYEPTGGGFRNAVGKLRTLTLISGTRDGLYAVEELGQAKQ